MKEIQQETIIVGDKISLMKFHIVDYFCEFLITESVLLSQTVCALFINLLSKINVFLTQVRIIFLGHLLL